MTTLFASQARRHRKTGWGDPTPEEIIGNLLTGGFATPPDDDFPIETVPPRAVASARAAEISGVVSTLPELCFVSMAGFQAVPFGHVTTFPQPIHNTHSTLPNCLSGYIAAYTTAVGLGRLSELDAQLNEFCFLPMGWDGEGGAPPSTETIVAAKGFLAHLPVELLPEECHAIGDGEIIFQWRLHGDFIEVAFEGHTISWYARIGQSEPIFSDDEFTNFDAIDDRLIHALRSHS